MRLLAAVLLAALAIAPVGAEENAELWEIDGAVVVRQQDESGSGWWQKTDRGESTLASAWSPSS